MSIDIMIKHLLNLKELKMIYFLPQLTPLKKWLYQTNLVNLIKDIDLLKNLLLKQRQKI